MKRYNLIGTLNSRRNTERSLAKNTPALRPTSSLVLFHTQVRTPLASMSGEGAVPLLVSRDDRRIILHGRVASLSGVLISSVYKAIKQTTID